MALLKIVFDSSGLKKSCETARACPEFRFYQSVPKTNKVVMIYITFKKFTHVHLCVWMFVSVCICAGVCRM